MVPVLDSGGTEFAPPLYLRLAYSKFSPAFLNQLLGHFERIPLAERHCGCETGSLGTLLHCLLYCPKCPFLKDLASSPDHCKLQTFLAGNDHNTTLAVAKVFLLMQLNLIVFFPYVTKFNR